MLYRQTSMVLRMALVTLLLLFSHPVNAEYGDIILNSKAESMRKAEVDDVVFPHWFHRIRYRCNVCHEDVFKIVAGSNEMTMASMTENSDACGTCHNGVVAWEPLECERCHSIEPGWTSGPLQHSIEKPEVIDHLIGKVGTRKKPYSKFMEIASGWHPLALTASGLPLDKYGLVNWAEAVREGIVNPLWTLDPDAKDEELKFYDSDILFQAKGDFMPDVLFPHDIHSFWLQCKVCHGTKDGPMFKDELGSNPITMQEIGKGKWCARCHDRVAFPISDCKRCHNHPKDKPIEEGVLVRVYKEPEEEEPFIDLYVDEDL